MLCFLLSCLAVLFSSEVGVLAFVALVVRQLVQRESLNVIMESITWLLQAWVLVQVFELRPLQGLLHHYFLVELLLLQDLLDLLAVRRCHSLLALRAVEVVEHDTRPVPLLLDLDLQTVDVVHVAATKMDAWLLAQSLALADVAVVFLVLLGSDALVHLLNALWLEARYALLLAGRPAARVATRKHLVASLVDEVDALSLSTYVLEGRFHTRRRLLELVEAVSAAPSDVFVARFTNVVRLRFTAGTEILGTLRTSDPKLSHVFGCFSSQ